MIMGYGPKVLIMEFIKIYTILQKWHAQRLYKETTISIIFLKRILRTVSTKTIFTNPRTKFRDAEFENL